MSFNVIPPFMATDASLTATNVAEPGPGEVVWVSGSNYAIGAQVIRTQTHRKYQSLVAITNSTIPPEQDPTRWEDIGPTNRYAALDYERNTAAMVNGTSISYTITPGKRVQTLTLFGLKDVEMVTVTARDGVMGPVIYTRTLNLSTRTTSSWFGYFFGTFGRRESVVLLDLPLTSGISIEVNLTRASSGPLSVETVAIGMPVKIGSTLLGCTSDVLDFSRIERDQFGNATLIRRKNVPVLSAQIFADKAAVPAIRTLRDQFQASPLIFLAIDDAEDAYFDALSMVGIFKRMPIVAEYNDHCLISIETEGL